MLKSPLPTALAALLPLMALGGCISLAARPPAALLTLSPDATPGAGTTVSTANAATITIAVPTAPAEINTSRVPVRTGNTSIAYIKDAQWSEPPARLFARLLADTVSARTGRVVLGWNQALGSTGAKLSGELRRFGVDESAHQAVIIYEASLQRGTDRVFETRRFEAREPIGTISADTAGPALNRAANKVAADVAAWVGS